MKVHSEIQVNGRSYLQGDEIPWYKIYPFFLLHMLIFGASGFLMAYSSGGPGLFFLYLHGGFAILVYTVFYFAIFGRDQVKWMFINSGLGLMGIYSQIDVILTLFGKRVDDFPASVHVIPFLYYIMYTFLLYHLILEVTGADRDPRRKRIVEVCYVVGSVMLYSGLYLNDM